MDGKCIITTSILSRSFFSDSRRDPTGIPVDLATKFAMWCADSIGTVASAIDGNPDSPGELDADTCELELLVEKDLAAFHSV